MRRPPRLRTTGTAPKRSRTSTTQWGHLYRLSRWTRASRAFRSSPEGALCVDCQARGLVVPSAITDHRIPHNGDLELFWDPTNWVGRCWACHSTKSRDDQLGRPRRVKGCDSSGFPLDPSHHWHQP
jgi:5-methylcytosine-specific restriction protein A